MTAIEAAPWVLLGMFAFCTAGVVLLNWWIGRDE